MEDGGLFGEELEEGRGGVNALAFDEGFSCLIATNGTVAISSASVCRTDDLSVLYCLRALCQWAEEGRYPQIGGGGSTAAEWQRYVAVHESDS